jgi:hypothetical protein
MHFSAAALEHTVDLLRLGHRQSLLIHYHDLPFSIDLLAIPFLRNCIVAPYSHSFIKMRTTTVLSIAGLVSSTIAGYSLQDDYQPSSFFSMFDFFTVSQGVKAIAWHWTCADKK